MRLSFRGGAMPVQNVLEIGRYHACHRGQKMNQVGKVT